MPKWDEYQEEAAEHFRSLGLYATTNERLEGARGAHDVDVVVRSRRAGLEGLWVVECKLRRRPVEKLHVVALSEIVQDVGADRGILLSEAGFQAGAIRMAYKNNLTLTSLADLRADAAEELLLLRLDQCRLRLSNVSVRLAAVGKRQRLGPAGGSILYRRAPGHWDAVQLYGALSIAQVGLRRAEVGAWPAPYAWDFRSKNQRYAHDLASFIVGLSDALSQIEAELAVLEEVNA